MVTINQMEAGAAKYIDAEIAPRIPTNIPNGQLKKAVFLAGATYVIHKNIQQYAAHPMLAQLGAMDEDGNIDLDGILDAARNAVPDTGLKVNVPILGDLTFYTEDLERLAAYIKEE